jgi:transporter family protein
MAAGEASVALALGAMVCLGLSDLLNKRAMHAGVRRTEFLVVQSAFFIATTIVLLPFLGGLSWSPYLGLAVVCGLVTFGSYWCVLRALERGEATVVTPIYRMSFAWAVVLAVLLLGEGVTARKLLGLLLVLAALLLLTATGRRDTARAAASLSSEGLPVDDAEGHGAAPARLTAPVAFAVLALLLIGTKGFLYKVGADAGASATTFTLVQAMTFLPVAAASARATDGKVSVSRLTMLHAPFNGVLTALAAVLLFLGLERGEAIVVVPISQLCFVVTAVLAMAMFKERLTVSKAVGVVAAVVAVIALSSAVGFPFRL